MTVRSQKSGRTRLSSRSHFRVTGGSLDVGGDVGGSKNHSLGGVKEDTDRLQT